MANALKALFGEIADEIRNKTGGKDTMTPAEFPGQIASIITTDEFEWVSTEGSFASVSTIYTISHNLGKVPDIFMIFNDSVNAFPTDNNFYLLAGAIINPSLVGQHSKYGYMVDYNRLSNQHSNVKLWSNFDNADENVLTITNLSPSSSRYYWLAMALKNKS